jgi:hypothetical protein
MKDTKERKKTLFNFSLNRTSLKTSTPTTPTATNSNNNLKEEIKKEEDNFNVFKDTIIPSEPPSFLVDSLNWLENNGGPEWEGKK